jgi:glycosyltransferase involved in cell wall biosynthesis
MGAPSARTYELSRRWAKQGAQVTVITSFPNHPTGVIPPEYRGKYFMRENKDDISIMRTYVFATPNEGFFKRILSYMSFMFSSIIQGKLKSGEQDIIIATSPQFFVGIAGYLISRLKKIPFIFEVRDLWPESIKQLGLLKNKMAIRILETIEMFLYRKASHVIGVADSTFEILTKRGIPSEKISIIKNGVDLLLFDHLISGDAIKKKFKSKDKYFVSYIGTHGLSHALNGVLDTAKILDGTKDIQFLFIGEGAEKNNLIRQAHKMNLSNVLFLDQVPKEDLPKYYAASDIVLVTLRDLPLFKCVIPSKVFEIMAMGKPILISVDGEARNLVVDQAKAGIFVQPENPYELAEGIRKLYQNKNLSYELGMNGRKFVEQYFNRNNLADTYLQLVKEVYKNSKG